MTGLAPLPATDGVTRGVAAAVNGAEDPVALAFLPDAEPSVDGPAWLLQRGEATDVDELRGRRSGGIAFHGDSLLVTLPETCRVGRLHVRPANEAGGEEGPRRLIPARGFGAEGLGRSEFLDPRGLAVLGDGRLVVIDHGNHRGQIFGPEGNFLTGFGSRFYTQQGADPMALDLIVRAARAAALLTACVIASSCGRSQGEGDPGGAEAEGAPVHTLPGGESFEALSARGTFAVVLEPESGAVPLNEPFAMRVHVIDTATGEPLAGADAVTLDARMPIHGHGMLRDGCGARGRRLPRRGSPAAHGRPLGVPRRRPARPAPRARAGGVRADAVSAPRAILPAALLAAAAAAGACRRGVCRPTPARPRSPWSCRRAACAPPSLAAPAAAAGSHEPARR